MTRTAMKALAAGTLAALVTSMGPAVALAASTADGEPAGRTEAIARSLRETMGSEVFEAARVLRFTWAVEREGEQVAAYEHAWDRWTGDYRLAGTDRESGEPWLALFNVGSRQGRAWVGGEELAGEALAERLEGAYGRFINDSYWLLMPWKWLDPGVNLAYVGTAEVDGETCDLVELTFGDDVGLTPNDRYRGFVSRDSGLMIRWSYILQNDDMTSGDGAPTVWDWTEWAVDPHGVWFSSRRTRVGEDGSVAIVFPDIELVPAPSPDQLASWFRHDG